MSRRSKKINFHHFKPRVNRILTSTILVKLGYMYTYFQWWQGRLQPAGLDLDLDLNLCLVPGGGGDCHAAKGGDCDEDLHFPDVVMRDY